MFKSNRIFRGSLRRTLVLLLLIIFVPLFLVQIGIYYTWFQARERQVIETNLDMARAVANTLDAVIRDALSHELALGSAVLASEQDSPRVERLLKISADEDKTIHSFYWVLPNGQIAITGEPNKSVTTIKDRPYFKEILSGQDHVISGFLPIEKLSGRPAITITRALRSGYGELEGMVVGVVTEEEFHNMIPPLLSSKIRAILIFDQHGTLIYRWPEVSLTLEQRASWVAVDPVLRRALDGNEATGYFISPLVGTRQISASLPVGHTGLVVAVARSESEIVLPIIRNSIFSLTIVLLLMTFFLLLALTAGRRILNSVLRLREHARAVGKGDLEHRADVGGINELQELGDEFNQMALQLKERKEQFEKTMADLKRSNNDLEQFAYVASHDLQEPLRAVSGFVELLKLRLQSTLDAKAAEYMDFAVNGVKRMQALIHGLLEYSRVGTHGKAPELTDSKTAIENAMTHLHASIKESGAKIIFESLPAVRVDSMQLTQLFQNLIGNAIKFRAEQTPEIHISAVRNATVWQFAVADKGIGIEPQHAERIFLIFQRLHTQEKYPGTGIGLAICRKIVERHGGKIWVESKHGSGSTFYFTIPDTAET